MALSAGFVKTQRLVAGCLFARLIGRKFDRVDLNAVNALIDRTDEPQVRENLLKTLPGQEHGIRRSRRNPAKPVDRPDYVYRFTMEQGWNCYQNTHRLSHKFNAIDLGLPETKHFGI